MSRTVLVATLVAALLLPAAAASAAAPFRPLTGAVSGTVTAVGAVDPSELLLYVSTCRARTDTDACTTRVRTTPRTRFAGAVPDDRSDLVGRRIYARYTIGTDGTGTAAVVVVATVRTLPVLRKLPSDLIKRPHTDAPTYRIQPIDPPVYTFVRG